MAEPEEDSKTHLPSVSGQLDMRFSIDTCEFIKNVLDKCRTTIVGGLDRSSTEKILDMFREERTFGESTHLTVRDLEDTLRNKTSSCLRELCNVLRKSPNSYTMLKSALVRTGQKELLETIENIETAYHDELKGQKLHGCECTDNSRCPLQEPLKCHKGFLSFTSSKAKDAPEAPAGPVVVEDITKDSVKLSWQPPSHDGGSPITGYLIELRDLRKFTWSKAGSVDKDTLTFKPTRLMEEQEYTFRIIAQNAEGPSTALESKPVTPTRPKCIREEPMDKPPSNHRLVVDAIRETKEYMALLNEWIPKRESTIREIESLALKLRNLKPRSSKGSKVRIIKRIGKFAIKFALGGVAAALAGMILGGGLATPLLLVGTAGAIAGGSNNSSGSDIVANFLLECQLESAQNVLNEDEALCERMNSVKSKLDLNINELSLGENLIFEQVQCSLLMATMIEGEFAHAYPSQIWKMLMTSRLFIKILSNSFGEESAVDLCRASTVAEEPVKEGEMLDLKMLGVARVGSICSLIKDAMDSANGSPSEAVKGLGNVAREKMKQVKDITDFQQKLRNQTACFERIMRDHFHERLEKVSTQGIASDDDTQLITFMLKYSSNAWQQAFQSLNVNLNEFAFHLARVFSNMKYILEKERNKRQENHLNITVIAHGRIDPHMLVPCHVYYFNNCLVSVTLYSPWGCAIDTSVIYGIATDTMMPQNVQYSADVSPERPATWNYLLREAELAPNIKCTPLLEDTDARHSLLEFVDILRFNSDDVIIPYFTGIGNDLLPYPEVPLWVFATAVGMCAQSLNLTINLKLAACLSPEKPDTAGTELSQFCQVPMDLNPPVLMTSQLDTDQEAAEKVDRLL